MTRNQVVEEIPKLDSISDYELSSESSEISVFVGYEKNEGFEKINELGSSGQNPDFLNKSPEKSITRKIFKVAEEMDELEDKMTKKFDEMTTNLKSEMSQQFQKMLEKLQK